MIELSDIELGMLIKALKTQLVEYEHQVDAPYSTDEYLEILFKIQELQKTSSITDCVLPDTKIWTTANNSKGEVPSLKNISNLKEGDKVLTHTRHFREITKILKREVEKEQLYVLINAHGKELHVTGEHPILIIDMVEGEMWIPAKDVIVGQIVKIMDDHKDFSSSEIGSIKTPKKKYDGVVYNLEVEEDNSYTTIFGVIQSSGE